MVLAVFHAHEAHEENHKYFDLTAYYLHLSLQRPKSENDSFL